MDVRSIIDTRRKGEPDMVFFLIIFVLCGIGVAMTYSASAVFAHRVFHDSSYFLKRQLLWLLIGIVALLVFQEIDYRVYIRNTKAMLLIAFALLIVVFIPGIGHAAKGSVRWLSFGLFSVQPAEFVKVIMVIYLAKVFSGGHAGNPVMQVIVPIVIIAVMFVLIMLQPDFGTAIDILFVSVLIFFVSGFPAHYIISLFILSIPMFYLLIYQVDYRKERILAFLNPWKDPYGRGYHIIQSFMAFRKGGFLGMGLGLGTQKIARLPEPHTDFIFAVIGEELGWIGTILMVALYASIFWRAVVISSGTTDEFGRLLVVGLSMMIVIQAFANIGVAIGILPTTGIPLPFVSYGGSSLVSTMIASGIILNISRYREVTRRGIKLAEEAWQ